MDEDQPRLLAHKVIQQMVRHMVSESLPLTGRDFMSIRVVFRRCGGSWEKLAAGDLAHIELLKNVVTAWGGMPGVVAQSEQMI